MPGRSVPTILSILAAFLFSVSPAAHCNAPKHPPAFPEEARLLVEYLKVDTSNPPGNEKKAAAFLKKAFNREGIENQTFEYAPGRSNFIAVLKGEESGGGIILFNHSDVVPAEPKNWSTGPFSGTIREGFIYGRGALDMKGTAIMQMMAMFLLKRGKVPLKRDVIFLSVADEEGLSAGSAWMVKNRPEILRRASFLLNEGENIHLREGKGEAPIYAVSPTEKSPLWLKLVAQGIPGHASEPNPDSSVNRLIRALNRVISYMPPEVLLPAAEKYFRDMKMTDADIHSSSYAQAATHNTISATVISCGSSINVIPSEASAELDCRLLPGEDPADFTRQIRSLVSGEQVEVKVLFSYPANISPLDTVLFRSIEKVARHHDPECIVTSPISTSSNDSHFFRELGITCYNFEPYRADDAENARSHGNDERISIENMQFGTRFFYELLLEMNR